MDIGRYLPAERLIEEVVLRGRAEVLAASDDVGNAHRVVVDNVREVVGGVAVGFYQDLILQLAVLDGDFAEYRVGEGRAALDRHFLADNIGHALSEKAVDLLLRKVAAVSVVAAADGFLLDFLEPLL